MKKTILILLLIMFSACQSTKTLTKNRDLEVTPELKKKQELTKSQDWVWAGDTGKGAIALKKDGSFWQFGRVAFDWGQITLPLTPQEKKTYIYHLEPKKIADGFKDSKIIHGGYRVYAIKKDGTLWVWKSGSRNRFIPLTSTHDWLTAGSKYEGNGCDPFEIGLKKDGSLWDLSNIDKIEKIGKANGFTKVAFGCSSIYAEQKDGTVFETYWRDEESIDWRKLIKNQKHADVYEKEALLKLARLQSGIAGNHIDLTSGIEIKKNGTLWLTPEVKIEIVKR